MTAIRQLLLISGATLMALGVFVVVADLVFIEKYGMDWGDVAGVTEDGIPVDWPTGERPIWAKVPTFLYSLPLWLLAAILFGFRMVIGKTYRGRIHRGAE